ncbi:MAG: lipopolysaccharide kinase InaA family protein [Eubacteriales bacterium]|nr:lipopolysaccharide kinase InaA family protein [Eubacteriales bacterium]
MSRMIGVYKPVTPLQTAGSGSARWCIALRGGQRFFLKEFLSPVYPYKGGNKALIQKQIERCQRFEATKRKLYAAMSCVIGDTLVPVLDFFCFESRYYAVSEEVPTPRLTGESELDMTNSEKREILLGLALCLQRLHLQGVVHADLKPEHVLLSKGPLGYEVRLIDLDSGFLTEEPPKEPRDMEGDPVYLAPEVFLCMAGQEATLGAAVDTFAFGAIIHRIWTGSLPGIDSKRYAYLYEAALEGGEISLSPELPLPYRMAVRRMLDKDPAHRPSDMEMVRLLTANRPGEERYWQEGEPLNGLSRFMKKPGN